MTVSIVTAIMRRALAPRAGAVPREGGALVHPHCADGLQVGVPGHVRLHAPLLPTEDYH